MDPYGRRVSFATVRARASRATPPDDDEGLWVDVRALLLDGRDEINREMRGDRCRACGFGCDGVIKHELAYSNESVDFRLCVHVLRSHAYGDPCTVLVGRVVLGRAVVTCERACRHGVLAPVDLADEDMCALAGRIEWVDRPDTPAALLPLILGTRRRDPPPRAAAPAAPAAAAEAASSTHLVSPVSPVSHEVEADGIQSRSNARVCANASCPTGEGKGHRHKQKLRVCSGCRATRYCSLECQRADWETHRPVCSRQ